MNRSLPRTDLAFRDMPGAKITGVEAPRLEQRLEQTPKKPLEFTPTSKLVECSGCGMPVSVGKNVVMAFCGDCSAKNLGRKR